MKDWKQNDNDLLKTACYAGVQNFQDLREIQYYMCQEGDVIIII